MCLTPNFRTPGAIPVGAYETRFFFGGQLGVHVPDETWSSREDSTGEFELHQGNRSGLLFWVDIWPVVPPANTREPGFHNTAKELGDWLAANRNVKVVQRVPGTLGGANAEVVDFERSSPATNDDPGCPVDLKPCVNMFGFEQWDDAFSSGGPFYNRLYTADVTWGGTHHVVSAMIWADTKAFFDEFAAAAETIVEGATLPAGVSG